MTKCSGSVESPQTAKKQATSLSSAAGADVVPVVKPAETSPGTSPSPAAGSDAKIARPLLPTEKETNFCSASSEFRQTVWLSRSDVAHHGEISNGIRWHGPFGPEHRRGVEMR